MIQVIWVVCLEGSKNSCSTVIDLKAKYMGINLGGLIDLVLGMGNLTFTLSWLLNPP